MVGTPTVEVLTPARPRIVVSAGRPAVTLTRPAGTLVATVEVPGKQGPAGPQGQTGPAALEHGFGQITYTERSIEPEDSFAPGVRQQLVFMPSTVQDLLNAPFAGFGFWNGQRIAGRAMGDFLDIIVNLIVTAQIAGGELLLDLDVGSSLGPTGTDQRSLTKGAGQQERITFRIGVQVLTNFLANGARLYLTSTVPLTVVSETIVVLPISTRPSVTP